MLRLFILDSTIACTDLSRGAAAVAEEADCRFSEFRDNASRAICESSIELLALHNVTSDCTEKLMRALWFEPSSLSNTAAARLLLKVLIDVA